MSEPDEAQEGDEEEKDEGFWPFLVLGGFGLFFSTIWPWAGTAEDVIKTIGLFAFLLGGAIGIYRHWGVTGFVVGFLIFFVIDETKARINCGPFLNKNGMMGLMFKASYPIEGDCRVIDLYPPLTIRLTEPILIKLGLVRPVNIFDPRNMTGE